MFAVKFYGEAEFWLSIGKVILIIGLITYTFIVMVGGNPQHDAFGFRYWKNPGSFTELYRDGATGRFLGFFYCLVQAAFAVAGPEYVSMTAGEAENPRTVLPKAYKSIFWRLTTFFMLGSLAVGILVPFNDEALIAAYSSGKGGAAASPVRALFFYFLSHVPEDERDRHLWGKKVQLLTHTYAVRPLDGQTQHSHSPTHSQRPHSHFSLLSWQQYPRE